MDSGMTLFPNAVGVPGEHDYAVTGINSKKLGMWAFLASECLFFGALISSYLLYRTRGPVDTRPRPGHRRARGNRVEILRRHAGDHPALEPFVRGGRDREAVPGLVVHAPHPQPGRSTGAGTWWWSCRWCRSR